MPEPTATAQPGDQDHITTTAATTPATPHMTPEHRLRYDLLRALDRYKATADYLPLVEVARAVEGGAYDHA